MTEKKKRWFHFRRPELRVGTKGVRVAKPSVRIGDKVGINISSRGISGSIRTKFGSLNTRRGCTLNIFKLLGCSTFLLLAGFGLVFGLNRLTRRGKQATGVG